MPSKVSCRCSIDVFHSADDSMVWQAMHRRRAKEGTARRHKDMFLRWNSTVLRDFLWFGKCRIAIASTNMGNLSFVSLMSDAFMGSMFPPLPWPFASASTPSPFARMDFVYINCVTTHKFIGQFFFFINYK